jgi:hypothetical protein
MANFFGRLMSGFAGFYSGFRGGALVPGSPSIVPGGQGPDVWGVAAARNLRYEMGWSFDGNTAYDSIHGYSAAMKEREGLYRAIRCIYNPTNRLNTFYSIHLLGGPLDDEAGDGQQVATSIPIDGADDRLRRAIARLWRDSRWKGKRSIVGRYGSMLGDVGLMARDDSARKRVVIRVVRPERLPWVSRDEDGRVTGYVYAEPRRDPEAAAPTISGDGSVQDLARQVTYLERCTVELATGRTRFETYKDGKLYRWPENAKDAWDVPWGFAPLVMIQHENLGLDFGQAEFWPQRSKIQELDDLASKAHDQIRKLVECPWIFAGVHGSKDFQLVRPGAKPTRDEPDPIRTEVPFIFLHDAQSKAQPMVADLHLGDTLEHMRDVQKELEKDLPEVANDAWKGTGGGEPNAKHLRMVRQQIEMKVSERRNGYDEGLVAVHRMAIAIGGAAGYEAYRGYTLDDYHADTGPLDHAIGERPVFAVDPFNQYEEQAAMLDNLRKGASVGLPPPWMLKEFEGWPDAKIKELEAAQVEDAARANADGLLTSQTNYSGTIGPGGVVQDPAAGKTVPGGP